MADPKPKKTKRAKFSQFFRSKSTKQLLRTKQFKVALAIFLFFSIGTSGVVLYYYNYYSSIIDRKLGGEIFKNTAQIYAAPFRIHPGQKLTADEVVAHLQRAGFDTTDKGENEDGNYEVASNKITIRPKVGDVMRLEFQKTRLTKIVKPGGGETSEAWLPAELVTNIVDETRQKRRIVEFKELPVRLVNALLAAEDQRFYRHWGLDPLRIGGAIIRNARDSDKRPQGGSTITQQLARMFFLNQDLTLRRKLGEAFIALILEQRLTKDQILTMYANDIYLGHRGSFEIHGFGEGAAAYFGKDLDGLTLSESATLVGIVPAPNAFNPSSHPDRAKTRRNLVLTAMRKENKITDQEFEQAKNEEIRVVPMKIDATEAPYLVDYIREELLKDFSEDDITRNNLRVYTSLDPALQRIAVEAVQNGLKFAREQIAAQRKRSKTPDNRPGPQASLIVLNPHTGEIKAMVGGADYGASQYNRIIEAARQPGSIFKPIVYAAALETAFDETLTEEPPPAAEGDPNAVAAASDADSPVESVEPVESVYHGVITPITTLLDEPTTFANEGSTPYEPNNYKQQYRGLVTVRLALQHSLNIPTIKVAERIGYDRVAAFAKRLGLNAKIKGYPSIALGAFEVTPIEMAGAYTAFANEGRRMQPHALIRVTSADGSTNKSYKYEPQEVMRPELAYVMTNLMQGVVNSGTGAGVRSRGFTLPAAGKTGTSRDGWFAGYTKDLLAIAWVGYDDNRDLNLEGSRSALPIWTEFMLKATKLYPPDPEQSNFVGPEGVEYATVDRETFHVASSGCVDTYDEVFIAGTVPAESCPLHGASITDTIEHGVVETGKGAGKVFQGIGRFIGGIFGGGGDKDEEEKKKPEQ
jgi:penicillin-binding protein 1B